MNAPVTGKRPTESALTIRAIKKNRIFVTWKPLKKSARGSFRGAYVRGGEGKVVSTRVGGRGKAGARDNP